MHLKIKKGRTFALPFNFLTKVYKMLKREQRLGFELNQTIGGYFSSDSNKSSMYCKKYMRFTMISLLWYKRNVLPL